MHFHKTTEKIRLKKLSSPYRREWNDWCETLKLPTKFKCYQDQKYTIKGSSCHTPHTRVECEIFVEKSPIQFDYYTYKKNVFLHYLNVTLWPEVTTQTHIHRDIFRNYVYTSTIKIKSEIHWNLIITPSFIARIPVITRYRHRFQCLYFLCIRQSVITLIPLWIQKSTL